MSNAIAKQSTENAVAKAENTYQAVDLKNGFSSITGSDMDARKRLYKAIAEAEQLSDHLGSTINLADVVVMPVSSENDETGEIEEYERTTLIDADGSAYAAGSSGVVTSLNNLFGVFGQPQTWAEPLAIRVVEKKGRKGFKFMTIELAD